MTGLENTYGAWSPDGRYLVFATERDGNPEVYRMRSDGSDGRLIYFNSNRSSDPASFARGTMERDRNHEIYSMTPTGGKSESGRNSGVFWMDLGSGEMRNVTAHQAFDIFVIQLR